MLLLSTSSLTWYGLHRVFQMAKQAGYTGLDLSLGMLNYDLWDETYIRQLIQEFDFPVLSLTAPGKDMSQQKLNQIILLAEEIGAQVITVTPPHIMDKDTKWFGEWLKKIKTQTGLSICVQNVEPKFLFFVIPEYRNASLEKIKKVTGDTTLDVIDIDASSNMDIMQAQEILGSSLKNVLLADKHGMNRGVLPGSAWGGLSYLPLESFLMRLKSSEYGGYITLKVSPKEMGVGESDIVLQNLSRMKDYIQKHFSEK